MMPGTNVGAYRIVEQIGRGGMATVYKAYQPALARHVAIKVLPAFFAEDPGYRERFQQEAIAVARLRHPNILVVFEYGEEHGVPYLVSEYVDGGTLAEHVGSPLPLDYVVRILGPIASALDYAHARGTLHRDVKPSNILLAGDGSPVLSDFGLAKIVGSLSRLTHTGITVGTPEYMAPEQGQGLDVGPAADIYALAVVAYEMLTGRLPFSAETPLAVLLAHMHRPVPSPRAMNPALAPEVEEALLKGLAKAPGERFPTATDFVHALAAGTAMEKQAVQPQPATTSRGDSTTVEPAVTQDAGQAGPGAGSTATAAGGTGGAAAGGPGGTAAGPPALGAAGGGGGGGRRPRRVPAGRAAAAGVLVTVALVLVVIGIRSHGAQTAAPAPTATVVAATASATKVSTAIVLARASTTTTAVATRANLIATSTLPRPSPTAVSTSRATATSLPSVPPTPRPSATALPRPSSTAIAVPSATSATRPSATITPAPTSVRVARTIARGAWGLTGSLPMPGLAEGQAILLRDGRVLVTGGFDNQRGSSREATLYDPHSGVWSAIGPLRDGRHNHTATLLANGTVLVVGGEEKAQGRDRILASAELFDPATGTWTATGSLHHARQFHTATLLRDGKVLVAGGIDARYNPVATAELYDPATGTWTDAGTMRDSHSGHTATRLRDGRVLVAGGGTTSAELYDPATGRWTATGSLSVVRSGHAATLLTDGRVLVTGGANVDAEYNPGWATAELYDPRTGVWTPAGAMSVPRVFHSATLLPGGAVLVAGGQTKYQGDITTASVDLYSPATGKWRVIQRMHSPRAGQIAVLLTNNLLLVAGGDIGGGATTATTELYNPGTGTR